MDIRLLVALGFVVISVAYGYPPQEQSRPSKAAYKEHGDILYTRPDFRSDARVSNIKEIAEQYDRAKKLPVHDVLSKAKHAYAVTESNEEKIHKVKHTTLTSEPNLQKYRTHIRPDERKQYRTEDRKTSERYVSTTKPLIKNEKYVSHHQTGPQTFTSVTEESRYEYHNEPGKEREIYIFGSTHTDIPYPKSDLVPPRKTLGYDAPLPDVEVKLYSTPLYPSTDTTPHPKNYPKTSAHGSPTLFHPTQSPRLPESSSAVPSYLTLKEHEKGYNYAKPTPKNIPYFTTVTPPQIVQQISEARLQSNSYYPDKPHDATYITTHKPEPSYTSPRTIQPTTDSAYYTSSNIKPQPYPSIHNEEHEIQPPYPKTAYQDQSLFNSETPERPLPNIQYSRESYSTEPSKISYHTLLNSEPYNHPSTTPNISPYTHHTKSYETHRPYVPSTASDRRQTSISPIEHKHHHHLTDDSRESVQPVHAEHQTESTLYSASLSPNSHSAPVPTYVEHESHHVPTNLPHGHNVQHTSSNVNSENTYSTRTPSHETLHKGSHDEHPRNLFSPSYEEPSQGKPNVQYNSNLGQSSSHRQSVSHSEYSTEHSFTSPPFGTTKSPYSSSNEEPPHSVPHPSLYDEERVSPHRTPSHSRPPQPKLTYSTTSRTDLHPSSFIEPPHSDTYSRLDQPESPHSTRNQVEHQRESVLSQNTPYSVPYPSSHIEPPQHSPHTNNGHNVHNSYFSPSTPQSTHYPQTEGESHKDPSPSYSATPKSLQYPQLPEEHHKVAYSPSPSYSTTPKIDPYPQLKAQQHKGPPYSAPTYSTTPQSLTHPAPHVEHHEEQPYPSPSYSTTPQSGTYPAAHVDHYNKNPYPSSSSYSTTPQSATYSVAHVEHNKEQSYPSPSYSTSHENAPYHAAHEEHHNKNVYHSPSYSTTPQSATYSAAHVEHNKEQSYPSPSYNTSHENAPYHEAHEEHHNKNVFHSPSYSTTPQSATYSAAHVEHNKEQSYPSPSYSTSHENAPYHAAHEEHHNKNVYHSPSYSTTPQSASYPAASAEHHKEPYYPSPIYSTTPKSSPYAQSKVEHHKEPSYPSPLYSTTPQSDPYPAAHDEHHKEPSYSSPLYSSPSQNVPYPPDHVEHHKEPSYPTPYSTTPQSATYSAAHVEHHKEPSYSSPSYSTTSQSVPYPPNHVEHHTEPSYPASYSTTPQSVPYSKAYVEHHKEPSYTSPSFITTPNNVPSYVEHQTKPSYPAHITSTPTVLVTSLPTIKNAYTKHPPLIKNTTPALSVLTNSISPESHHEIATNRIHSKITTHPIAVTDHPRHLYQPSPESEVSKESQLLIRPWYFVFDH